jgi:YD repeat-containing protein
MELGRSRLPVQGVGHEGAARVFREEDRWKGCDQRTKPGGGRPAQTVPSGLVRRLIGHLHVLLFLLLGSALPGFAHASSFGCQQLYSLLTSTQCNEIVRDVQWSCFTTPVSGLPDVTEIWSSGKALPPFINPQGPSPIAAYTCSLDPSKNAGSGHLADGGVGHDNGGAGSGTGGNGASPNCSCADNKGNPLVGDPINIATGYRYLQDDDYLASAWLTFRRFYNSGPFTLAEMGPHWRHSFDRTLLISGSPATSIQMLRPDGKQETFTKTDGVWTTDSDIPDTLTENDNTQGTAVSYTFFVAALRQFETYNTAGLLHTITDETGQGVTLSYSTSATSASVAPLSGLLLSVTDPQGRQLNFNYNGSGLLAQVTLPDGGTLAYTYDSSDDLLAVKYPDGQTRQYVYNESSLTGGANLPGVMTGIVDEAGVRYESTSYNSTGQGLESSFAGGVGATQFTYNSNGSATVQYPLGMSVTLSVVDTPNGFGEISGVSQPCGSQCNQPWKTLAYDANDYPSSSTDFNGNTTATTYSSTGLLNQQIDAEGTSNQRTITINWNAALRVPLSRTVSDASSNMDSNTQWVYNTLGESLARCDIDPTNSAAAGYSCSNTGTVPAGVRRSTYTYCTAVGTGCPLVGLMLTATGPRTDLTQTTSYTYYTTSSATNCGTPGAVCYQPGDLYQVTDALGHVTTIVSYDADGRITRLTDANGVNTDMTYTPRGWLASRTVGGATTRFTYTAYGAVQTVTDPDGVTTTYGYDTAHRLTTITDALGNYVQYTLDAAGDKTGEQVTDASGTVHKSLTRTFNTLGQLTSVVDGLNNTVFNASASTSYDANGNLIQSSDALGIQRQQGYDALNRLVQTLDNYNGTN